MIKDLDFDQQTVTILNRIGTTAITFYRGNEGDERRVEDSKRFVIQTLAPFFYDGRAYEVQFIEWACTVSECCASNRRAMPIVPYPSEKAYQCWLVRTIFDVFESQVGDYFLTSDVWGTNKMEYAGGEVFELIGILGDSTVWHRIT